MICAAGAFVASYDKGVQVGEFTRARIVGTQGHDLIGLPV